MSAISPRLLSADADYAVSRLKSSGNSTNWTRLIMAGSSHRWLESVATQNKAFEVEYRVGNELGSGAHAVVTFCMSRNNLRGFACKIFSKLRGRNTTARQHQLLKDQIILVRPGCTCCYCLVTTSLVDS